MGASATPPPLPELFVNSLLAAQCSPRRTRTSCRFRRLTKRRPLDHSLLLFTPVQVREAIMASGNSTAHGPDHLNILHLKHLDPTGISYLCSLFNLSLASTDIPSIWKQAIIIALLKAGKPASLGTSYRPISLLSPTAKVLERLLLPILNEHLHTVPTQHGFRTQRSTTTALLSIAHSISSGFNQRKPPPPCRTVSLAIDFSKAFDTVPHDLLLDRLMETTLPSNVLRWLSCYLHGRSASCQYRQAMSDFRSVGAGVPQGSVISPCLFNFFVSDYPHTADLHSSYADDFTAVVSDHNIHAASQRMSDHAADALQWAADHGLQVSVNKSNCTLFTSDTHQSRLDPSVSCNGNTFPLCRSPKLLGVTFDTHFTFSPHIRGVAERARSRLGIVKALAGMSWGQSKEVLLLTYQMLIKPILSYAAPVWFPNAPTTTVSTLQSIQNSALRIATASLKMASTDHLHQEASVLPVLAHLSMLCSQFLLSALRPNHPSYPTVTADSGPRNIRQSRFRPLISAHLIDGITQPDSYRESLRRVHSDAVAAAIAALSPNRLLGVSPPAVSASEWRLPRAHRTTLSQLRSGFSSAMRDYRHRIGAEPTPECPECADLCHSVPQLFSCPARPSGRHVGTTAGGGTLPPLCPFFLSPS